MTSIKPDSFSAIAYTALAPASQPLPISGLRPNPIIPPSHFQQLPLMVGGVGFWVLLATVGGQIQRMGDRKRFLSLHFFYYIPSRYGAVARRSNPDLQTQRRKFEKDFHERWRVLRCQDYDPKGAGEVVPR